MGTPYADTAPLPSAKTKCANKNLALETPRLLWCFADAHPATPYAANLTAPARVNKMLGDSSRLV